MLKVWVHECAIAYRNVLVIVSHGVKYSIKMTRAIAHETEPQIAIQFMQSTKNGRIYAHIFILLVFCFFCKTIRRYASLR